MTRWVSFNEIHQSAACDTKILHPCFAVRCLLGYERGRSTAGVTATLRQVLSKAAEWGVGAFVASADVEGAFDGFKHDDVENALLQKGVHPESVCSLLRESSDLKGRINLPGAPMSPAFLYARGARQGSVEGPDMWNQVNGIKEKRNQKRHNHL